MTQVSFYSLSSTNSDARMHFACRLTEKAYSLGHRVYIQAASTEQARSLDELLWQFSPSSFIPHAVANEKESENVSVVIGHTPPAEEHQDVFINLASQACESHSQFSRINEIITADKESLQQGRLRYRFYKEQGYQPETFKL
ncbi:MAG: DNA polymerase III subunit chi [SAR86 cluster bacterium]|uniref:DNA polymerase III subunit chi n=1 Tax=SAR86 cluster bacterium TaxID=2030880 RepID=A0A2A5ATW6_9GAMM|nr:MAG: DNA polymerase III subunit chi [SAR86 cluster bacterium]